LPAVPGGPTLVSATRAAAAVRANWPLRDLRNNPPDEPPGGMPSTAACRRASTSIP
jgi:hypothetical protein